MKRQVLEDGTENALHHGRGLELRFTYRIRSAGGNVRFDRKEQRDNVVTLELSTTE